MMYVKQGRRYLPATPHAICEAAAQYLSVPLYRDRAFSSPHAAQDFLRHRIGHLDHEVFVMLALDNRHRLIEVCDLFRGTIDGASVYPREVVKEVLRINAAAVVFAHNHPSGVCEPSDADESITRRLSEALGLIDVRVLDHVIVTRNASMSFVERGLM